MHAIPDSTRRAVGAMMATEVVRDVALSLQLSGVDVMPVKGALFQHLLYSDPSERALTDVDVVVRPSQLELAVRTLVASGYRRLGDNGLFALTFETRCALTLDLHGGLFDRARYRYNVDQVFRRAIRDEAFFGASVLIPSPEDVYAQLIGKCVSDHVDERTPTRLAEVALAGDVLPLDATTVARYLVGVGMGRASRYVLPVVARVTGDRFALEVERALRSDPLGGALAKACHALITRTPPSGKAGAFAAHLLNESIPRGLWSGTRSLLRLPGIRY